MDEKQVFDKINEMLEDTDYPIRITNVADLDDFLLDDDNRRFEEYFVIGRMYDNLKGQTEINGYLDESMDIDEE